MINFVIMTALS